MLNDVGLPVPGEAADLDGLVTRLRLLKTWAGAPSYAAITARVNDAWRAAGRPDDELARRSTVADCFRLGRTRLDDDLVVAIVHALRPDPGYAESWRAALRVVRGEATTAALVETRSGLPDDPGGFIGREAEVDAIGAVVHRGPVVVSTIDGMAGVGKTRLALHTAHRLLRSGHGRDLQLFVDLRGFDPTAPPADPAAVLADFLRHLGAAGDQIPPTIEGRAQLYRKLLSDKSALVVLDNAADAQAVAQLLPCSPTCVTLVTSRHALTDLPDACHVDLDVFSPAESLTLLRRVAGANRVDADPETAKGIADLVGHLPLALSVVAGHLRDHPDWLLTDYLEPLTALAMEGGVRAALVLSDRDLPARTRRLLRLLALHPGQEFDAHAAAALADLPLAQAQEQLDALTAAHLLHSRTTTRYGLHDLVRAYARELVKVEEPPSRARQALGRLFDHYRHTALVAMDLLYPHEKNRRPRPEASTPSTTPGRG